TIPAVDAVQALWRQLAAAVVLGEGAHRGGHDRDRRRQLHCVVRTAAQALESAATRGVDDDPVGGRVPGTLLHGCTSGNSRTRRSSGDSLQSPPLRATSWGSRDTSPSW